MQEFRTAIVTRFKKAPDSLFYHALGFDAVGIALQELGQHVTQNNSLLGVRVRSSGGMYTISPEVLEIRHGKIDPVVPKS